MEPLTLTLLGYPLSVFANLSYDTLKKISTKTNLNFLKKLFLKAFYKSLDIHSELYDDTARKISTGLKKAIKKDEVKLLMLISDFSDFSTDTPRDFFKNLDNYRLLNALSFKIAFEFLADKDKQNKEIFPLTESIIKDCFSYYKHSFLNVISEKEGIQTILLECFQIRNSLDLLKKIDSEMATKEDFDHLRSSLLSKYSARDEGFRKSLKEYDNYIKNRFKHIELRGFSPKVQGKEILMKLEDIFVPLKIDREKKGFLKAEEKTYTQHPFFQDKPAIYEKKEKKPPENETAKILKHRSIVILGDPGSGKSTLLRYLTVTVSRERKKNHLLKTVIPLYIRIAEYAEYYKKNRKTLYEFITEHYDKQYQHLYKEGFEYSNLMLLLDGLDEITDTPLRIQVTDKVMDLMARYPFNRYIVTSRIVGYQEASLGGDFTHYQLQPFDTEKIKNFSINWYRSIAKNTDKNYERAAKEANNLNNSIERNSSVLRLAANPLLMTIIAMIHYKGKQLPSKRIELYEVSTETFLEHWVKLRVYDETKLKDRNEIIEILAPIAFEIHENKSEGLIEEKEFKESFKKNYKSVHTNESEDKIKKECREFIKFLREESGFFYDKGRDEDENTLYGFMHLTFQEYFAAIEMVSLWKEGKLKLEKYAFSPRWIEVIRLAAAQIRFANKDRSGRIEATMFVKDILTVEDQFPEAFRPLQLVCLILSDNVAIQDEFLNEIIDRVIAVLEKSEYEVLVESFSKHFKEILLSDYKKQFTDRLCNKFKSDNSILLNNLLTLFWGNTKEPLIKDFLESLLKDFKNNERFCKNIFKFRSFLRPFVKSEVFKDAFQKYLRAFKDNLSDKEIENMMRSFTYDFYGERVTVPIEFISIFRPIPKLYKIASEVTLYSNFSNIVSRAHRLKSDHLIDKYSDIPLIKKITDSLKKFSQQSFGGSTNSCLFELKKTKALFLYYSESKKSFLFFINFQENKFFYHEIVENKIVLYLKKIKSNFSEDDLKNIELNFYFIMEPQGKIKNDISNFFTALNNGYLYNFFGWQNFPIKNLNHEPEKFSKVIVQHAKRYIESKGFKDLKNIDKKRVSSPVQLMIHQARNQPVEDKLIQDNIAYYKNSTAEEKEGAFTILYKTLNPFAVS